MADDTDIHRSIDGLLLTPLTDGNRVNAALTVCEGMGRTGSTVEQIRDVLASLDLLSFNGISRR
jgi:hypothetical protein